MESSERSSSVPTQALNPFMPGAGIRPPELVGRERDLEAIDRMVARTKLQLMNQGIIYSGLRGVGKTVLLLSLQEIANSKGMATARIEAEGDPRADYDKLFREIGLLAARLQSSTLQDKLSNVISNVESVSLSIMGIGGSVTVSDSDELRTSSLRLELVIESIVQQLRSENSGLYLFIDELQEMDKEPLGTLIAIQHRMGQENMPFYLIGAGLPNLPGVLSRTKSYAERLFDYRTIGQLSEEDTAEGFQKPAQRGTRPFSDEALKELVHVSHGYPYFIQAYGKAAWNASDSSPISLDSVKRSEPIARAELDQGLYASRWQRASLKGREYMATMAHVGGDTPCSSSDIAEDMGKTPKETSVVRNALIRLGLIYSPERGKVAFTVPGMGEFITRATPPTGQAYDQTR